MRAVLSWGPVARDLDIHVVVLNKTTNAICHVYYVNLLCPGCELNQVTI